MRNFSVSLISDNNFMIIVIQKLQFMQEFTLVIKVGCLHSNLLAKLLMYIYAGAKHAKKSLNRAFKEFFRFSRVEMHIFNSSILINITCLISHNQRNDRNIKTVEFLF